MRRDIVEISYNELKRYLGRHVGLPGNMFDVLESGLNSEELREKRIKGKLKFAEEEKRFYVDCKRKERDICQILDGEIMIIYPEIKWVRVVVD